MATPQRTGTQNLWQRLVALQPLGHVLAAMNAIGTIWIMGLMVLINADILGRTALNAPLAGVPEMVTFSIAGIVFLQLAHALRSGAMTRSDVLLNALERRFPRLHQGALALFNMAGAVLLVLVLQGFWPVFQRAWDNPARHFTGTPGLFTLPLWPLYALMLLGIAATALQFLTLALGHLATALRSRPADGASQ